MKNQEPGFYFQVGYGMCDPEEACIIFETKFYD